MSESYRRADDFRVDHVAGAIVGRTEHGNLHAGMLYRHGRDIRFLHLGWQDALGDEWGWGGLWASPPAPVEKLVAAAAMCRLVWRRFVDEREFPYALRFEGTRFDGAGRLVLGPGARGLTCATLILAVLSSVGIAVVIEDTWPVRPDADEDFLAFVQSWAKPEHFALLRTEVDAGIRRIWPDEVVAACAGRELPATFETARRDADVLLEKLDAR